MHVLTQPNMSPCTFVITKYYSATHHLNNGCAKQTSCLPDYKLKLVFWKQSYHLVFSQSSYWCYFMHFCTALHDPEAKWFLLCNCKAKDNTVLSTQLLCTCKDGQQLFRSNGDRADQISAIKMVCLFAGHVCSSANQEHWFPIKIDFP